MTIYEEATKLEALARELDSLTVIERAYAMQAFTIFKNAARYANTTVGDLIHRIDKDKLAVILSEVPHKK